MVPSPPTLNTCPLASSLAAACSKASTASSTYVKSLNCSPSHTSKSLPSRRRRIQMPRKVCRASFTRIRGPYVFVSRREQERRLRSEEHTSELQSRLHLVCRLLLEKK